MMVVLMLHILQQKITTKRTYQMISKSKKVNPKFCFQIQNFVCEPYSEASAVVMVVHVDIVQRVRKRMVTGLQTTSHHQNISKTNEVTFSFRDFCLGCLITITLCKRASKPMVAFLKWCLLLRGLFECLNSSKI